MKEKKEKTYAVEKKIYDGAIRKHKIKTWIAKHFLIMKMLKNQIGYV